MLTVLLPCFYAFAASFSFCVAFRIRGGKMVWCALGGALGWLVYLVSAGLFEGDIPRYFLATCFISAYSELLARRFRAPATVYLAVALLPLVPGGGIYNTMEYCITGQASQAVTMFFHTLGVAGALAMGIIMVSSTVRLFVQYGVNQKIKKEGVSCSLPSKTDN